MSFLKTEALYFSEKTVHFCQTIQKCRNTGDDFMSLSNCKGLQRKKENFPRPGQYSIVCERKCKEYQGHAVVSTDSRPEAKPNIRLLLYLISICYSQEVHELNPLQAGHIFLSAHKSYLKNYGTDLNSVLPLAVYIKSRLARFVYHPSNKRKRFYSNEINQCTKNI
jgi:hypothetical protein